MSILLDATMDDAWFSGADRAYYQDQSALRATNIRGRSGTGRYLVAGAGHGHLVQALRGAGNPETWGVDLSPYALERSKETYPAISARFVPGDCRSTSSMATVRQQTVGGNANQRYNVIVSEDLLSAMGPNKHPKDYTPQDWIDADAEAVACATALRSVLANNGVLVHIISMVFDGTTADNPMYTPGLWHTGPEWRALLPAADRIVHLYDMQEY